MKYWLLFFLYCGYVFASCKIKFINNSSIKVNIVIKVKNFANQYITLSSNTVQRINLGNNISCNVQDDSDIGSAVIYIVNTNGWWTLDPNNQIYRSHGDLLTNNGSVIQINNTKTITLLNSDKITLSSMQLTIEDTNRNTSRILSSFN